MPRVSAAHEQEVRDRILAAAAPRLRREGLPQRHDRRRRPRERPVGRRDLHLLHRQGRAVPAELRPDRRARASTSSPSGSRRPRTTAERLAIAIALYVETIDEYDGAPGQVTLVQAWAEADREPGVREMLAGAPRATRRRRPDLLAQGVASGELPAWLDVDAVTRGFLALLDGLLLQRDRGRRRLPPGRPRAPGRRDPRAAAGRRPSAAGPPGAGPDGVASRPWPTSRPSSARSSPPTLGFTLPHEHTQIALWHIPARWDYWQLTRDEPVILDELARYRAAGGSGLVDLTLPGVGRDPAWLRGLAEASGLHIVMGCGWYRTAYYPAEARIDRRSVDDLADELVREIDRRGGGDAASGPGSSARSGPTSRGSRRPRSASIGRRRGRRAGPGSRSRPTRVLSASGSPSSGSSRRRAPIPAGSSSATPTRTRSSTTTSRSSSAARTSSSTSSGCPGRRSGTARAASSSSCCELLVARPCRPDPAEPGRLPRLAAQALRGQRLRLPRPRRSCPASATPGVSEAEIETMTVANPRRLLTIG